MNEDDLILTPLSPDNDDEAFGQFGKSIKIFKAFQFSISRKNSHLLSETALLQKEENLVEQLTVQLTTDKTAIDDESVTKKSLDNSFKVMPFDKQKLISPSTCSLNKKENIIKKNMYQRRQKGQNKNTSKEKIPSVMTINRKDSGDSINNNALSSTSESFPADSIQNLTNKRLKKKNTKNILMDDGTIVTSYAMNHPKRNRDFHNLFKNIPHNEYLMNDYTCALQREILLQGRIFVSLHHICFYSNIFSRVTNVVIPFSDITAIEKRLTAFVIPNAIQISVGNTKYSFTSLLSRDSVYELLMKLWKYPNSSEIRIFDFNEIIEKEMSESSDQSSINLREEDIDISPKCLQDSKISPNYLQEDSKVSPKYLQEESKVSSKYLQEENKVSSKYLQDSKVSSKYLQEDSKVSPKYLQEESKVSPIHSQEESKVSPIHSQEDSKIHNETTCDCLTNNRHFNNVVWDTKFKGSVEKIYNLLYASEFISEFLKETERNGESKCNFEVLHQDFDKYVTIMKYTETPNVFSGRGFKAKTRTCIMQATPDTTRVIATSAVEPSCIISVNKFTIEKSYFEGQLAYYKKLETAIHKYISQNLTEFVPDMSPRAIIEEGKDIDNVHSSRKQNFIKKSKRYLNEDTISNKLRMLTIPIPTIPTMSTIVLIAFILTLITNICYLVYLKNINDNFNDKIIAKFIERSSECIGETCPLNEWLDRLRKRQLSSILENV